MQSHNFLVLLYENKIKSEAVIRLTLLNFINSYFKSLHPLQNEGWVCL